MPMGRSGRIAPAPGFLEELHRLYDVIPDTYISSIAHDGTQIERTNTVVQVRVLEVIDQLMAADIVEELDELKAEIAIVTSGKAVPFQVQGQGGTEATQ